MEHRSPNRHSAQISLQPAGRANAAMLSIAKSDSKPESRPEMKRPFFEDFNMEHSCSNVAVVLRAFSAAGDSGEQNKLRNPAALSMNTPSCIYLG
ncbi:MAG: hypothetical protein ACLPY1_08535 [Terracidiphilus sp.]